MSNNKLLKIIVLILIILIVLLGIIGIYKKDDNKYLNIIPDYKFGMDIAGYREFNLKVDDSESEKEVYLDKDGKIAGEVTSAGTEVEGYTIQTVNVKANEEENLNSENFEKVKSIIEKRAKALDVEEYFVKLNRQNGDITIELAQNDKTDENYGIMTTEGKLEMVDYQNGIELMNNDDFKSATVMTNQDSEGHYELYLQLEMSDTGLEKMKQISSKYIEYKKEGETESTIDYVAIKLDGVDIKKQLYFPGKWESEYLPIAVAQGITSREELVEIADYYNMLCNVINAGKLPVKYSTDSSELIKPVINSNYMSIFQYVLFGIALIIAVVFAFKYKKEGFEIGLANIGFIASLLIIIRYLKIIINIPTVLGIFVLLVINTMFYVGLLQNKDKEFSKELLKYNIKVFPFIIVAIVFTLTGTTTILAMGSVLFWGIVISEIYSLLFVKIFLDK